MALGNIILVMATFMKDIGLIIKDMEMGSIIILTEKFIVETINRVIEKALVLLTIKMVIFMKVSGKTETLKALVLIIIVWGKLT